MALPDNVASTRSVVDLFNEPDSFVRSALRDYEAGGIAIGDPSEGLLYQWWECFYRNNSEIVIRPVNGGAEIVPISRPRVQMVSITFDQNMQPAVTYEADGEIYLWWYDSQVQGHVTTNFGAGKTPRVALDDKRAIYVGNSDIILAYIRDNTLYYRQQRDRYGIERTLRTGLFDSVKLRNIGMARNYRLYFELV